MEVEGTPAGNSDKPAKKPAAKKPAAEEEAAEEEDAEKADSEAITEEISEESEEVKAPNSVLGDLDLAELREFQDLVTYSDLGE